VQVRQENTDFRDTLAVLATVKDGPGYAARVLALKEEGLGLSILEAEDLAVATDVQLTLNIDNISILPSYQKHAHSREESFEGKNQKIYTMTLKRKSMRIAIP
jgi:hypothetical protein